MVGFSYFYTKEEKHMEKKHPIKIDIVKIHMVKDGSLEYRTKQIKNPQDLAELGMKFLKHADREMFVLVCLDSRNCINCIQLVSMGTVNTTIVTSRDIIKTALLCNALQIAFIHNHPSGDVEPSENDIQITKRLTECGALFDIQLLDHVIISDDGKYQSFLEKGLIKESSPALPLKVSEKLTGKETRCRQCGNTYIVTLVKKDQYYNDCGIRHCPFCGNMTYIW
jgi:DNA repair protein RadC